MSPRSWGKPPRTVHPAAVAVAPELVGRELAAPWRRLVAMLVDLLCVAFVSLLGFSLLMFLAGLVVLRASSRQASSARRWGLRAGAAMLAVGAVVLLVGDAWDSDHVHVLVDGEDVGMEAGEAIEAVPDLIALSRATTDEEAGAIAARLVDHVKASSAEPERVDDVLRDIAAGQSNPRAKAAIERALGGPRDLPAPAPLRQLADAIDAGDRDRAEALRSDLAEDVAAPELRAARAEAARLKRMNGAITGDLEEARKPPLRRSIMALADDLGLGVGWWLLYFTAVTTLWRGRTVGKRLVGVRVVRLDGKPLTWWVAFNRTGGYAASLFTGMMGFIEIFFDAHRQALHDKIAWTVVVREEAASPGSVAP